MSVVVILDRATATIGATDNFDNMVNAGGTYDLITSTGQVIASLSSLNPLTSIPGNSFGAALTGGKILSDLQNNGSISAGDLVSLLGNVVAISGTVAGLVVASPAIVVGASVGGLVIGAAGLGIGTWERLHPGQAGKGAGRRARITNGAS